ncbi:MAG: Tm-1-like ATP-binding domain-containing protein, partial [Bacteroidetes bacterium]|nr:Tm-1-like ATP-binding domain-containing protein [Bacteroidota bacterium]
NEEEIVRVAKSICDRLQHTKDKAYFMIPKGGVGVYSRNDGKLYDPVSDAAFFNYLKAHLPDNIEVIEKDLYVEDPKFVREGVDRLIELIEAR